MVRKTNVKPANAKPSTYQSGAVTSIPLRAECRAFAHQPEADAPREGAERSPSVPQRARAPPRAGRTAGRLGDAGIMAPWTAEWSRAAIGSGCQRGRGAPDLEAGGGRPAHPARRAPGGCLAPLPHAARGTRRPGRLLERRRAPARARRPDARRRAPWPCSWRSRAVERPSAARSAQRWGPRELDLDLLLFGQHHLHVERADRGAQRRPCSRRRPVAGGPASRCGRARSSSWRPWPTCCRTLVPPGWGFQRRRGARASRAGARG